MILLLLAVMACAVAFFPDEISRLYGRLLNVLRQKYEQTDVQNLPQQSCPAENNETDVAQSKPDLDVLDCRIRQTNRQEENGVVDVFSVELCGTIHAPGDNHHAVLVISILDVTDGENNARPVQAADSSFFSHNADLGRLPQQKTTLSEWTSVAKLRTDQFLLPRKGNRSLQFNISILSAQDDGELAGARCSYLYDNPSFGYMDVQDNIKHSKTLAVALAFAVSAVDAKMSECEIELIKKWAKDNIDLARSSDKAEQELDRALNEVIAFYREGNKFDCYDICREIVEIIPVAGRCEIIELCLNVAKASGSVAAEELRFLKDLANWMEIDGERFRELMEKVIPLEMHEVKDVESILGVTSDMNTEIARARLNKEYVKWNARVTNTNPDIQSQADQMLKLIAEARAKYIQQDDSVQEEKKKPARSTKKVPVKQGGIK